MRRKDLERSEEFALMVADQCEWAVLGMTDPEGGPYCVPVSIVRDGMAIYFHGAKEGLKTDSLRGNNAVCLSCVGHTRRLTDGFDTDYESAVLRGTAREVADEKEKVRALELLCLRHTPANKENFDRALAKHLGKTAVWRIDISSVTGKAKPATKSPA
jgi:nitroimidazol reductase NimA-like FMN-containing flavoprotein (pyridoxamine 5'-phosphate oxidase superfamily)